MASGTFSVLLFALDVLQKPFPTYIYLNREGTIPTEGLPSFIKSVEFFNDYVEVPEGTLPLIDRITKQVQAIREKNPNATFSFYLDTIRTNVLFSVLERANLPIGKWDLTLVSDGTYEVFTTEDARNSFQFYLRTKAIENRLKGISNPYSFLIGNI